MKGQLILQGQRGCCLEAEKLDPCLKGGKGRQGKQTEALLSSSVTWPGPAMVVWAGSSVVGVVPGTEPACSLLGCIPPQGQESQLWGGSSDHYSSPAFLPGWRHFGKVLGSGAQREKRFFSGEFSWSGEGNRRSGLVSLVVGTSYASVSPGTSWGKSA